MASSAAPPDVVTNLTVVRARIGAAAARSGRGPDAVTLVAVTKGVELSQIQAAASAGITDFGENRVQEALPKIAAIHAPNLRWHMIGHLQRNKVARAISAFSVIHSVDSERLAAELSRRATGRIDILLQVNVSGESQQHGLHPDEVAGVLRETADLPGLRVVGLMTIAPQVSDPERVRPVFRRLRQLRDELNALGITAMELAHLSMGMTDDYGVAVEEGATLVRIGRAIFGERPD